MSDNSEHSFLLSIAFLTSHVSVTITSGQTSIFGYFGYNTKVNKSELVTYISTTKMPIRLYRVIRYDQLRKHGLLNHD